MKKRVNIIVGPTAVGKSEVALIVAEKLDAWIISADSRQVYKGMNIGTSKPNEAERSRVRHLLIDIVEPDHVFSAAEFMDSCIDAINRTFENGKNPLIVGGTGLYIRALVEGFDLANTPRIDEIHDELIDRLENNGLDDLVRELHELDPIAENEIDTNNPHRVIRALEIVKSTGKSLKESRGKEKPSGMEFRIVGLRRDRKELSERISRRTYAMIDAGWLDEVRELMKMGLDEISPAMSGIGYYELRQYLNGEMTLDDAIEKIIIRTRQYAKRQMTWFNREENIRWIDLESTDQPEITAEKILKHLGV
jgi:tRNA dimethylallyltransferase